MCCLAQRAAPLPAAQLAALIATCSEVLVTDTAGVHTGNVVPLLVELARAAALDDAGAAELAELCGMLPPGLKRNVVMRKLQARV